MKKFMFTALALVAFSSVSMANELETVNLEAEKMELRTNCETVASLAVMIAEEEYHNETGNCFDTWTYNYIYNNALYNCQN